MHVGHAGVLAPFRINGPLRVAERGATLDILSGGRFELGLAKSGGKEWETFGVDPETARDELREALQMIPKMWTEKRFGWDSKLFQMPEREVVPRPLQKPHPRLWQTASSPDSFRMAGELGVGVLGTTLLSPVEPDEGTARRIRRRSRRLQEAGGATVQSQKGVFTFVHVAESRKAGDRERRGMVGAVVCPLRADRLQGAARHLVRRDPRRPQSASGAQAPARHAAIQGDDPTSLDIAPDEIPVIALLKRMARGENVSNEEAHEVLESSIPSSSAIPIIAARRRRNIAASARTGCSA